jgi:hypothetical protein
MHPPDRLGRHRASNPNLLVRILHLELKPAHHARNRAPQLGPRKILPYTRALAVQEGNLREVRRRPAVPIARLVALLVCVDPALRDVLVARVAPEVRAAIDGVRADHDARAAGHARPGHGGVADGFANGHGHGRVQPEDLLANAVEEGHGFQVVPGDGVVGGGDSCADFLPQAGLHVGVLAELVAAPCQCAGGGLVLF